MDKIPCFKYNMKNWFSDKVTLDDVPMIENQTLFDFLGRWENIQRTMPSIYQAIKEMAQKDNILVADLDSMDTYVKKLIEQGEYYLSIDRHGQILPTIRNSKTGKIVKMVRLKEVAIPTNVHNALNNLFISSLLLKILDEIKRIGLEIKKLHIEMQNDRIALAESAHDKLHYAIQLCAPLSRVYAILDAISSATDSKRILMKKFSENLKYIRDISKKSHSISIRFLKECEDDIQTRVSDAFETLVSITQMVRVECEGYDALDERDSMDACLSTFAKFINENELDKKDTLLLLNENSIKDLSQTVDAFTEIMEDIVFFKNKIGNRELEIESDNAETALPIRHCKSCGKELRSNGNSKRCDYCLRKRNRRSLTVITAISSVATAVGLITIANKNDSTSTGDDDTLEYIEED